MPTKRLVYPGHVKVNVQLIGKFWKDTNQIGQKSPNLYKKSIILAQFDKYIQISTAQNRPAKFANSPIF